MDGHPLYAAHHLSPVVELPLELPTLIIYMCQLSRKTKHLLRLFSHPLASYSSKQALD